MAKDKEDPKKPCSEKPSKAPDTSEVSKRIDYFKNELNKIQKNLMEKIKILNPEQLKNDLMNKFKTTNMKDLLDNSLNSAKDYVKAMCSSQKGKMSDKGGSSRAMKYPYTFSAKIAQFPLQHYAKNQWIWKYYFASVAICLPIFYSINKLANSPGNVAKWAEIRRKEAAEHHH